MDKRIRKYIGIILLLIIGLANIPFAWLHHCEYSHKHFLSEALDHSGDHLEEEVPECPLCELTFPPYVSESSQEICLNIDFYIPSAKCFYSVYISDYQEFVSLRGPPIC